MLSRSLSQRLPHILLLLLLTDQPYECCLVLAQDIPCHSETSRLSNDCAEALLVCSELQHRLSRCRLPQPEDGNLSTGHDVDVELQLTGKAIGRVL